MTSDRPPAEELLGIPGLEDLPAPSSLLSSRWSRDNLLTGHPARLYDGRVRERIDQDTLERLLRELEQRRGPVHPGAGRMGVFTWDVSCADDAGPFTLQVPLVLDERGQRDRSRRDVPWHNVENMRHFRAQGLTRFVAEPKDFMTLGGEVPAATFAALPDHHPIAFGRGSLHVELAEGGLSWLVSPLPPPPLGPGSLPVEPAEGESSWLVSLGPLPTADLLAEMVAALVYHYEPDTNDGTAITDTFVNDGGFVAERRS